MPLYRCVVHKFDTHYNYAYQNVYTLQTVSVTDAMTTIAAIREMERAVATTQIHFTGESAVNKANKLDRRSQTADVNGVIAVTGLGGPVPPFLTVRCEFGDNVKRPEQKYLRLGSQVAHVSLGKWDGEYVAYIDTNYTVPLLGSLEFVGPSGERPTTSATLDIIQARQEGWHRRHRPGFKRGWVPV
jgi:hypothetical protein